MVNHGYCAISGFPIDHPYWLEELAEAIYTSHPDGDKFLQNLMKSINSDQTSQADAYILGGTPQVQFWWKNGPAVDEYPFVGIAADLKPTRTHIEQHLAFYISVLKSKGHDLDQLINAPGFFNTGLQRKIEDPVR